MGETVSINNKRYYVVDENNLIYLPSVTTIIGTMSDKTGLDEWRKKVGEEEADKISKFSANRGTLMHTFVENFLTSEKEEKRDRLLDSLEVTTVYARRNNFTEDEIKVGRKLFFNFYNADNFDVIKRVVMQEKMLFSLNSGGYAGRVDNIYEDYECFHVISDYKTSRKPKKEEWIENYKMQISAYFVAYWEMFGIKPKRAEIWISNEQDHFPQIFTLTFEDIKIYYAKFIQMVKDFHAKFPSEVSEYISKEA
jgi:genome maintenance exonuclease 1